jgi:hypothetical protein
MMLLSGYTLGFFFPKQAMHISATQAKPEIDIKADRKTVDLAKTRPDAGSESREVPAAYYFYRYF